VPSKRLTDEEIDQRGTDLYDRRIRPLVEKPEHIGKQVVIDVRFGDYEVDEDGLAASRRMLARHPEAVLYGLRIGYNAVYTLGGVLKPTQP
jgi:hypothetical protein